MAKLQTLLAAALSAQKEGKTFNAEMLKTITIDRKHSIYDNLIDVVNALIKNLQFYVKSAYKQGGRVESIYARQHKAKPKGFEDEEYEGNKAYIRTGGVVNTIANVKKESDAINLTDRLSVNVTGNTIEVYWAFGTSHYHPSLFGDYEGKSSNTLNLLDKGYRWKRPVRIKWFTWRPKGHIVEGALAITRKEKKNIIKTLGLNIEIETGRDIF